MLCEPFVVNHRATAPQDGWPNADVVRRQQIVARLAKKHGAAVVHFQAALDRACRAGPASHWIWDDVHPTYSGHQILADAWERGAGILEIGGRIPVRSIRWPIAILITVAVAIGYLDRQTLALTVKAIQRDIPLSDGDFGNLQSLFYFAYALMYVGGGRLMDLLGTRRGFLLIVVWWSLAIAGHGLAHGLAMLMAARLMLGLAQGGVFPAAAKAVAEWFPARKRATAMGLVNGGSSVGAVLAPPLIALVLCYAPWPWVYYLSGAVGLLWTAWWLWDYYPPARHPRLSEEERREIHEVLVSAPRKAACPGFGC